MTREEQVLIRGKVFLYKQKAPFVPSGKSVLGALEYREADDKVRCHECGEWFTHLATHTLPAHGLSSKDYKQKHGLQRKAPLMGPAALRRAKHAQGKQAQRNADNYCRLIASRAAVRSKRHEQVARAESLPPKPGKGLNMELRNERGTCQAQLLTRIQQVADYIGRTPTRTEFEQAGVSIESAKLVLNVSTLAQVMALAGLMPRMKGSIAGVHPKKRYTKEILIELLRDFWVKHKRVPTGDDATKFHLLPPWSTYLTYFPSREAVYEAAGLRLVMKEKKHEAQVANAAKARIAWQQQNGRQSDVACGQRNLL